MVISMRDVEFENFLETVRDRQEAFLASTGALEEDGATVVPGVYETLGVVYRYFGDLKKSNEFFEAASKSYYPHEDKLTDLVDSNEPERLTTIAYQQAFGGISSSLVGDKKRAKKLFRWAAENLRPIEDISTGPASLEVVGESLALGGFFLLRGYCLLRAGMYKNALKILQEGRVVLSGLHEEAFGPSERYLIDVLIPLCEYKLNPDEKKRSDARKAIENYKSTLKENLEKRKGYLYIFDLQDAFPEVYKQ